MKKSNAILFPGKGRKIDWAGKIVGQINILYGTQHETVSAALIELLTRHKNCIGNAAACIGVSPSAFRRQLALSKTSEDPLGEYIRTAPAPQNDPHIVGRIDVTFDYVGWLASPDPNRSVCHHCSNKRGDKYNVTCVYECPARSAWAKHAIDIEENLGFPSIEREGAFYAVV